MNPATPDPGFFLPPATLWWREVVRFYRQPSRVVGAFATPVFFWLLIGSGLGTSFRVTPAPTANTGAGASYLEYFLPGTVVLILLFTAIFSTISIIEDRRAGFLQGVLVAPVSRSSIVLGKVLGGATLAFVQGLVFLFFGLAVGIRLGVVETLSAAAVLLVVAFALTALGFALAWSMDSIQGFHSIMNLFLIPMWLLSGALFPPGGAFPWIQWIMRANPLFYGVAGLRHSLYLGNPSQTLDLPPMGLCMFVTAAFAALMFAAATGVATRRNVRSFA